MKLPLNNCPGKMQGFSSKPKKFHRKIGRKGIINIAHANEAT